LYTYIINKVDLVRIIPKIQNSKIIELDIETSSLDIFSCRLLLLQLNLDGEIFVINCCTIPKDTLEYIMQILHSRSRNKDCIIIGHNIIFDVKVLYHKFKTLLFNLYDTMLGDILTRAGLVKKFPSLEELVDENFNVKLDKEIRNTFIDKQDDVFTEQQILYSALDVKYLTLLRERQLLKLTEQKQVHVSELEMSLIPVFAMMEYEGIDIDTEMWRNNIKEIELSFKKAHQDILDYIKNNLDFSKYKNTLELSDAFGVISKSKKTKKLVSELESISPEFSWGWFENNFNPKSNAQTLRMVNIFGVDVENTNEKTVKPFINHPIVKLLDGYREAEKKLDTYGESFLSNINPKTKKIHTSFKQLGTATGRLSSDGPNLQNIPRESIYRHAFIAPQGYSLIKIDYSQAELRLMACVSGEPEMIKSFINQEDLHVTSASAVYKIPKEQITKDQRQRGKNLNFGLIYGISEYGLYYTFGIPIEEGRRMLKDYFGFYQVLEEFIKKAGNIIEKKKFSITPFGRKRFFEDKKLFANNSEMYKYIGRLRREGVNHIIQGGIADVVKIAMREIFYNNPFGDGVKILLQVHDELVFAVRDDLLKDAQEFLEDKMIKAGELFITKVPVKVDANVAKYWEKG